MALMDGGAYIRIPWGCLYVREEEPLIMDSSCPICGILKGGKVKGCFCKDCESNRDLKNEFEWYKMVVRMKLDQKAFIVAYWLLIFFVSISGRMNVWALLFLVGLWYYNVWNYRRYNYDKRISDSKEKMFLIKLRGVEE